MVGPEGPFCAPPGGQRWRNLFWRNMIRSRVRFYCVVGVRDIKRGHPLFLQRAGQGHYCALPRCVTHYERRCYAENNYFFVGLFASAISWGQAISHRKRPAFHGEKQKKPEKDTQKVEKQRRFRVKIGNLAHHCALRGHTTRHDIIR